MQPFWALSTTSASTADLTLPIQDGTYRVVVMKADGTPGMTTQLHAAVTVPHMFDFALGALVGGLLRPAQASRCSSPPPPSDVLTGST